MPGPWDKNLRFWDNATVSATGASANKFNVGEGAELRIQLRVTGSGSGTSPTLDVKVQDSADGSSFADTGLTFAQVSGTSTVANKLQQREFKARPGRPWVQLLGTIGGSSSPQFAGVYGEIGHWSGKITAVATTDP
jgi:hypothetical protein